MGAPIWSTLGTHVDQMGAYGHNMFGSDFHVLQLSTDKMCTQQLKPVLHQRIYNEISTKKSYWELDVPCFSYWLSEVRDGWFPN